MFILLCAQILHVYNGKSLPLVHNTLHNLNTISAKVVTYLDGVDKNVHSMSCDKWYNYIIVTNSALLVCYNELNMFLSFMALYILISIPNQQMKVLPFRVPHGVWNQYAFDHIISQGAIANNEAVPSLPCSLTLLKTESPNIYKCLSQQPNR